MKSNRIFIQIFFLLFSSLFFAECKKYEEDDVFIQWKRPEKRLLKYGPWVFEKLTVDGVDKSAEFRLDSAYFDKIEFKEHQPGATDIALTRNFNFDEIGKYEFVNKKKKLSIRMLTTYLNGTDYHNYGPLFKSISVEWEIIKLTKNNLKLSSEFNGSIYIIEMVSIQ